MAEAAGSFRPSVPFNFFLIFQLVLFGLVAVLSFKFPYLTAAAKVVCRFCLGVAFFFFFLCDLVFG